MDTNPVSVKVRCRLIQEADLQAVAALLDEGFAGRGLTFWTAGLARLASRAVPEGAPRYGYCLDAGGAIAGVILLIAAERSISGEMRPFTNVAGWYVREDFRAYAQLLVSMALKSKTTSYFNVSAAPHTWPIVEKQGYRQYCAGLYFALAALVPRRPQVEVIEIESETPDPILAAMPDGDLLRRHAAMGCRVVVCREGEALSGFVFRRLTARKGHVKLPAMFVIHATDRQKLLTLAGNLGRHFLRDLAPFLVFDANGPVAGFRGFYTERRGRKYVKGPLTPELCALADTEFAYFGL